MISQALAEDGPISSHDRSEPLNRSRGTARCPDADRLRRTPAADRSGVNGPNLLLQESFDIATRCLRRPSFCLSPTASPSSEIVSVRLQAAKRDAAAECDQQHPRREVDVRAGSAPQ